MAAIMDLHTRKSDAERQKASALAKGPEPHACDLGFQQIVLKQHLAQVSFEPPAFRRLAVGGPEPFAFQFEQ